MSNLFLSIKAAIFLSIMLFVMASYLILVVWSIFAFMALLRPYGELAQVIGTVGACCLAFIPVVTSVVYVGIE